MIDPWELLLHHSYAGTPGVIFDDSPGRKSHGRAVDLTASDFWKDGAGAGSGAVAIKRPDSRVSVTPVGGWHQLSGIKCEFVCRWESGGPAGMLIDGGSFTFSINGSGTPNFTYSIVGDKSGVAFGPVSGDGTPAVPPDQWVTIGFVCAAYDGISFNLPKGKVEYFNDLFDANLLPTARIAIGNELGGGRPWVGQIDDVKVWRLDPHWVDNNFTNRPVDPGIQDCWLRWNEALKQALKDDPECAIYVMQLFQNAVKAITKRAMTTDPATKATWQDAVNQYQSTWPTGDLNAVGQILGNVMGAIGGQLQLKTDPALAALANDPCVQKILSKLPKLDCDPDFTNMMRQAAHDLEVLP